MNQTSPVSIVTIKNKIPLFKGDEQANSIEKIQLEEVGFSLVAQKDLYNVGDNAVYIQPDYCLPENVSLFNSFTAPFGDPKKSKLGKNNRIRAVKFNLHTGDNEPVYSVGILLPKNEVQDYLDSIKWPITDLDWTKALGITKYEEPDKTDNGGVKAKGGSEFPSYLYKTDETNINNLWGHLETKVGYPVHLVGSVKDDGSSITLLFEDNEWKVGSRTKMKKLKIFKIVGRKLPSIWQDIRWFFGFGYGDLNIKELVDNDDDFVKLAKPYIDKIDDVVSFGEIVDTDKIPTRFALRGEVTGQNWKGSGNKNNPRSKEEPKIRFFGLDFFDEENGHYVKQSEDTLQSFLDVFGFERTPVVINQSFKNREEIEHECKKYFKTNLIEGIVLRTRDHKFSAKFMNDEYDSKK